MAKLLKQFAALPVMETGGTLHVLLITSRTKQRWIIPKGHPEKGMRPAAVALLEAREEAGVAGTISKTRAFARGVVNSAMTEPPAIPRAP